MIMYMWRCGGVFSRQSFFHTICKVCFVISKFWFANVCSYVFLKYLLYLFLARKIQFWETLNFEHFKNVIMNNLSVYCQFILYLLLSNVDMMSLNFWPFSLSISKNVIFCKKCVINRSIPLSKYPELVPKKRLGQHCFY